MDEPTSALGGHEADQLFAAVRALRARGKGVIYVSHRLSEIFEIADEWTVLRDGAWVGSGRVAEVTRDALIQMIVGRPLTEEFVKENAPGGEVALSATALGARRGVRGVSFELRRGEILALYGLMGSGRTEILERLFGLAPEGEGRGPPRRRGGGLRLGGRGHRRRAWASSPRTARAAGSCSPTTCAPTSAWRATDRLGRGPVASARREAEAARRTIERFGIRAASDRLPVASLSGGNQQKVVLGKWFLTEPRVLLLDEPTRGVDVGAKREIYRLMSDFAAAGGSVLLASSEVEEVLGMADRALVMRDGRVAGVLDRDALSAEALVHLAA